jgi:hypothetical protein
MMGIEGTKIIGDEGLDADKLQAWLDSIAAWANGNVGLQSLVNRYAKSAIGFTLCADDDTADAGVIPVDPDTGTPRVRFFTKLPLVEGLITLRNIMLTGQAMKNGGDLVFTLWTYPDETFTPGDALQIASQTLTNPGAAGWVYDYDELTFFPGDRRFIEYRLTCDDVEVWNRVTWCAECTWQLQEF